jgi:hypothetical protein
MESSAMKKQIRSTLGLAFGLAFFCCTAATAAPFDTAVSTAMQTLSLGKGDSGLLLMTDAPCVKVDGRNAPPYLATAQELTGCSVGRGNLLFFQRPQSHPLRFMLFHKASGEAVIISPGEQGWSAQNLNLGPAAISQPAFWERTGDYQAGQDLFTLAALDHLGEPERFVSAAATFDLDESRYQRLIEAGSNPYEVVGLVK